MTQKKKIAFIHRYGLEGWICCGGHAIPRIIENLSNDAEIHFYGPKTTEPQNPQLRSMIRMHELPYRYNRANPRDKYNKTILWYFWLPIIGIHCRLTGTTLIWNDETIPLTAPILRIWFGKNLAITVMDFFLRIYTENRPALNWLCNLIERIDFASWRKLPLIFTKVLYTQRVLIERGIPSEIMHLYRNPIDHTRFHPVDENTRKAIRKKLGFSDDDIVLSHHGILHPNKGNSWIFYRLKEIKDELPNLKYLLIGNGPAMNHLQQLADQLGISEKIVFTGWLPTEKELNDTLASADIGLVMRIGQETDHFHMTDTLAHEMACGKPILAVKLRGIAEIIQNGNNGFVFNPEDPSDFHQAIIRLARAPQLRQHIGKQAYAWSIASGSPEHCSAVLTSAFRAILY